MHNLRNTNRKSNKMIVGLLLLTIGSALLLRSLNLIFLPGWLFSWPLILIIIGVFSGLRRGFWHPGSIILILLGSFFLAQHALPENYDRLLWPMLIIGAGLWMLFGRSCRTGLSRSSGWDKQVLSPDQETTSGPSTADDKIDSVAIFGGVKKNIVSKNFLGGEIVNIFGGSEINLMQADINGKVKLEVVQVFGGTKIIVPANWAVHSEMVAIFGGIDDKRPPQQASSPDKVLIIVGTSILGGIDIRSF